MQKASEIQLAHRSYLESRILSAQPVVIVEALYQIAIGALETALKHLKSGDAMARSAQVSRAQEAVNELILALDHTAGASFTQTLASLYVYVQEQILRGHTQKSEEAFRNAIKVLTPLLEGWSEVRRRETQDVPAEPPILEEPPAERADAPQSPVRPSLSAYQEESEQVSRDWSC